MAHRKGCLRSAGQHVNENDPQNRARIRRRALMLGLLVVFLYLGIIVLTVLRNPAAIG
jgi:hypothetical protein